MGQRIVAGILRRGDKILICQRRWGGLQGGRWEFPGGKLAAGESECQALRRELEEELGIAAQVGALLARRRHHYAETGELELAFYQIATFTGEPENRVFQALRWVEAGQLAGFDWLAADRPLLQGNRMKPRGS